jgi:hypothetical protein
MENDKKITVKELQNYVDNLKIKRPSKWAQAVKEDAVHLLENFIEWHGEDTAFSKDNVKELLNGAEDWKQYSYGGSAYAYDSDIARHYCTESELKKVGLIDYGNGFYSNPNPPNSKETWLDVQARALYQASELIKKSVEDMEQKREVAQKKEKAPKKKSRDDDYDRGR